MTGETHAASYSIGWSQSVLSDSEAHGVTIVDMKTCLSYPSNLTLSIIIIKMFLILTVVISLVHSVGKYKLMVKFIVILHTIEITVHPESRNTTLNSTVCFTCEANTLDIIFLVDGTLASHADVINRGFTQKGVEDLGNGKWRRMLLTKALENKNNTNISCRAQNGNRNYSNIAVLRIQGELEHYYIFKLIAMCLL